MPLNEFPIDSLMYITNRPDIVFTHGKGSWLYDHTGKRYLDFIQGWAVNSLGHCNDGVVEALKTQAERLLNPSPAFYNEPMAKLAGLLTQHSVFDKVFFANSGAEANEGAIKLARKWGRKFKDGAYEIITFDHSFHGRTLATMSASGKPGWDTIYAPQVPGFPKAELNDIASVEKLITGKTVAVMLEPIQGEGGVIPATREFMQQLRELTRKHNLLLIVDEVQSGCGRAGTLFAYELSGVEPDIMTLGKGIGSGVPLAALLAKAEVAVFEAGDQGGHLQRQPADDGRRLLGDLATGGAGLPRERARARRLPEAKPAATVGGTRLRGRARRGPAARPAAGQGHRPADRREGARHGPGRPAAERGAPEPAALHAGAERDERGNRPDDGDAALDPRHALIGRRGPPCIPTTRT